MNNIAAPGRLRGIFPANEERSDKDVNQELTERKFATSLAMAREKSKEIYKIVIKIRLVLLFKISSKSFHIKSVKHSPVPAAWHFNKPYYEDFDYQKMFIVNER